MSHTVEQIALKSSSPGTQRFLKVHRFNAAKPGPKVYMQAALHADEWPGLLTLQHLITELIDLDKRDLLRGEIVIVPYANPIGMDQRLNGVVLGRHSFSAEGNFNRHWPDFSAVTKAVRDQDPQSSVEQYRQALRKAVAQLPTQTPLAELKATLLALSIDADIVLDLHCDSQALVHIYANYRQRQDSQLLAQCMRSPIVLLEDEPGGSPFDAAHILPWIAIESESSPGSCFTATVELRGFADVDDQLAKADAQGLVNFLSAKDVIQAAGSEMIEIRVLTTDLEAVDSVRATATGIVCWAKELGDWVEKGELIAEVVDLLADSPAAGRTAIYSRTRGMLFTTNIGKLVCEGDNIGKIAGTEVLVNETGEGLLSL